LDTFTDIHYYHLVVSILERCKPGYDEIAAILYWNKDTCIALPLLWTVGNGLKPLVLESWYPVIGDTILRWW